MKITIELELDCPNDLKEKEIQKDILMGIAQDQIGFNYDYIIKSVNISNLNNKKPFKITIPESEVPISITNYNEERIIY